MIVCHVMHYCSRLAKELQLEAGQYGNNLLYSSKHMRYFVKNFSVIH